ncbi:MAG: major facilitator superfamily 1 [Pseudonocardia sp.]|nr:major facilitator superfamily 1 [Pseudonocardia sp.]
MSAAYAAFVPIVEIPSGILAHRWSRRGVLVVASTALALCALVGGLSHDVPTYILAAPTYILAALVLGVHFAMESGTMDSVIYDTVLEETGSSGAFERRRRDLVDRVCCWSGQHGPSGLGDAP